MAGEFLTTQEAASALGVSARHARRLADSGALEWVARGLVDRRSVDRYLSSQRQGRTRAWAEHTAWGAVAILSGRDADWLGGTQGSRLRSTLRTISEADDLLSRMRDRAKVHTFHAHRAALPRLRELISTTSLRMLGITDAVGDQVDGYLPEADLDQLAHSLGLRADSRDCRAAHHQVRHVSGPRTRRHSHRRRVGCGHQHGPATPRRGASNAGRLTGRVPMSPKHPAFQAHGHLRFGFGRLGAAPSSHAHQIH